MILKSIGKSIVLENYPLLNSPSTWGRGVLVYKHLDRLERFSKQRASIRLLKVPKIWDF